MKNKEYALIVAGGKGTRMQASLPKQFLELRGLPILMHTINAFFNYSSSITVVLVLPESDVATWQALCAKHTFNKSVMLQHGGATRFQSVKNGLEKIDGDGLVAIHDGVRPLVSNSIIATSFREASTHSSAVAAVALKESIRVVEGKKTKAVDRSVYRLMQTPQTFDVTMIKKAYQLPEDATVTDDASVAERFGHEIFLFEGSYHNIKITTPEDLIVAEALWDSVHGA